MNTIITRPLISPALDYDAHIPGWKFFIRHFFRLIALLLCIPAIHLSGQPTLPTPCVPDCANNWGPPKQEFVQDPTYPGCWLTVTYVERAACGMYNDIQILDVSTPSSSACGPLIVWMATQIANPDWTALAQWTASIHTLASEQIIKKKFLAWYIDPNTPPSEKLRGTCGSGPGDPRWRAIRGTCVYIRGEGSCCYSIQRCPQAICCLKLYRACFDPASGEVRVTPEPNAVPVPPCTGDAPPDAVTTRPCIPICNDYH